MSRNNQAPAQTPNKAMIINANNPDMTRVVITNKSGRKHDVIHFDIDSKHQQKKQTMSNVYKAVVTSIEASLGAVFVNFGSERHGFLPLSNISSEYFLEKPKGNPRSEDLARLIKVGQELVVQVEKEERGNKGAALTTFISLAGSYVVLMPNNDRGGGVSRQIEGSQREALKTKLAELEVPEGMSLIARTAGVGRSVEDLKWDLNILLRYWDAIKKAAIAKPGPYLIVEESDIVLRSVRDHFRQDIDEVMIDEPAAFERVRNYINLVRPDFIDRIKLFHHNTPIFSYYQVETQVSTAFNREVRLRSGASIVIDQTEALVAIDVNSSRATKGSNIEETALQTNLQAASEIARQIRFRDLSGLIVIDFIDMVEPAHRRMVEERLADAMSVDRARVQRTRISELGLLELSRQRLRRTLTRLTNITCPRCDGQGLIRTIESLANSIIHNMQDNQAKTTNPLHFTLHCPLDLTTFLMNERRADIQKLTDLYETKVTIIPNAHMLTPNYQLKQAELDKGKQESSQQSSYQQIKQPKTNNSLANQKEAARTLFDEPVINQYLNMPTEREQQAQSGLLGRLAKRWFGGNEENPATEEEASDAKNTRPQRKSQRSRDQQRPRRQNQQRRRSDSRQRDRDDEKKDAKPVRKNTGSRTASNSSNTLKATPKPNDKPKRSNTRRGSRGGSRNNPSESTVKTKTPTPEATTQEPVKKTSAPLAPAAPAPEEKKAPSKKESAPVQAPEKTPEPETQAPKKTLSAARRRPTGGRARPPMPKKVEKTETKEQEPKSESTAPPPKYKKTPSSARQTRKKIPEKSAKAPESSEK